MFKLSLSVGAVVMKQNQMLIVKHSYGPTSGKWDFVRGYVEHHEAIDLAIEREVREETSIIASVQQIIGIRNAIDNNRNDLLTIWLMSYLSGEPVADGREIKEATFMELKDIVALEGASTWLKELASVLLNRELGLTVHPYTPNSGTSSWKWFSI